MQSLHCYNCGVLQALNDALAVLDALPVAVSIIGTTGGELVVEYANRLSVEMSGVDSARGLPVGQVFPGSVDPEWIASLEGVEDSTTHAAVVEVPPAEFGGDDGTTWLVESHRTHSGRILVFAIDATSRYRYGRMLEEALESRGKAFEALATVAHEMRQPVSSILGFAEIAGDGSDPQVGEFLEIIREQATELAALVDDLVTSGLAASGRLRVDAIPVAGTDIGDACRRLAASFPAAEVEVRGEITETVVVDLRRIGQVVRGLLQNAVKYGGEQKWIELVTSGESITLAVCDDGPGLTPEEAESVFEPFQTGVSGTGVGSGIGLALARSVVHDMGGTLEYLSGDAGACFVIRLPVAGAVGSAGESSPADHVSRLLDDLVSFRTEPARRLLNSLSLQYTARLLLSSLIQPVMYRVGEMWAKKEVSVAQEHHASTVVNAWLVNQLSRTLPRNRSAVVCSTVPGNQHENGIAGVAVAVAECGFPVVYLGRDVPAEAIAATAASTDATAVLVSLTRVSDLDGLNRLAAALGDAAPGVMLGFGGRLFVEGYPPEGLPGTFVGGSPEDAVTVLETLIGAGA